MPMKSVSMDADMNMPKAAKVNVERKEITQEQFIDFMVKNLALTRSGVAAKGSVTEIILVPETKDKNGKTIIGATTLTGTGKPTFYSGIDENGKAFVECDWNTKFLLNGKEVNEPKNIDRITYDGKGTYTIKSNSVDSKDGRTLVDHTKTPVTKAENALTTITYLNKGNEFTGPILSRTDYRIGSYRLNLKKGEFEKIDE